MNKPIINFTFTFLLIFFSLYASATQYRIDVAYPWKPNQLQACQYAATDLNSQGFSFTVSYLSNTATHCTLSRSGSPNISFTFYEQADPTCTPPAVYDTSTGLCTTPNNCQSGSVTTHLTYGNVNTPCISGCNTVFSGYAARGVICQITAPIAGYSHCDYSKFTRTGTTCSAPDPNQITVPPIEVSAGTTEHDCISQGKTFGTVNGLKVCLPKGTTGSEPVIDPPNTKTTTNPNGSTTTTTTTTTVNNNGTVTTNTTITNKPSPTDPNQTPTTTQTTDNQDLQGFCEANPSLKICTNDPDRNSSGGTACDSAPTCTGDEIDCVTQKQIYNFRCQQEKLSESFVDTTEEQDYKAGTNSSQPTDQQASDSLNKYGTLDIDVSQDFNDELSNNKFNFGSASCPPPLTLNVLGKPYQLPLDVFCSYAVFVKFFIMFFAMMLSLRIYTTILFG